MRQFATIALLLGFVTPISASMHLSLPGSPVLEPSIPSNNDFNTTLTGLGFDHIVKGNVTFSVAGTLTFYAHASESGFTNKFHVVSLTPYVESDFGWYIPGYLIGTVAVGPSITLADIAKFTTSGVGSGGYNANVGDNGFGIFAKTSSGSTLTGPFDTLYFGYDDNGATPDDDNHDDLIIRAVFEPLLGPPADMPEPVSAIVWGALCALGLLMTGRSAKS